MAHILAILPRGLSRHHPLRIPNLPKQLLAKLIETHHRKTLITRAVVDLQDIFHVSHEVRVLLGRDAPALLQPRFDLVFLSS